MLALGVLVGGALALGVLGCGALDRRAQYTSTGPADPRGDSRVKEGFERAQRQPLSAQASQVTVMIDTLPDGLAMKDGVLTVEPGFDHRIVGKFELTPELGFFPGYRDDWRRSYCHPQQILLVGTLFVWTIVPLYYPCFTTTHLGKEELVDDLKRIGQQAGGDWVIASYVWQDQDQATGVIGFVVASGSPDPAASAPAAVSDAAAPPSAPPPSDPTR
jgi:hypothetical protein